MNELVKIPFGEASRVGLTIPAGVSEQDWKTIGHNLCRCKDSLQFWIGDWVNYGQTGFKNYDAVMEVFAKEANGEYGYEKKTLENFASVAKRVEISLRREKLTFGHHSVVASMDPVQQDIWLAKAVMNAWSVADLTREIRRKEKNIPVDGGSAMQGLWSFENWFRETENGFKDFFKRVPLSAWSENDLRQRIFKAQELIGPMLKEADSRGIKLLPQE